MSEIQVAVTVTVTVGPTNQLRIYATPPHVKLIPAVATPVTPKHTKRFPNLTASLQTNHPTTVLD